jgi:hypothetical protein
MIPQDMPDTGAGKPKRMRRWIAAALALAVSLAIAIPLIEAATLSPDAITIDKAVVQFQGLATADSTVKGTASVGPLLSANSYNVGGVACTFFLSQDGNKTWQPLTKLTGTAKHSSSNKVDLDFKLHDTDVKALRWALWNFKTESAMASVRSDCEVDVDVHLWKTLKVEKHFAISEVMSLSTTNSHPSAASQPGHPSAASQPGPSFAVFFDGAEEEVEARGDDEALLDYFMRQLRRQADNMGQLFQDKLGLNVQVSGLDLGEQIKDLVVEVPKLQ